MPRMLRLITLISMLAGVPAVSAVPITLTLSDPDVMVNFGGASQTVDLEIVISADTDNFQASLASGVGSGYANVLQTYTSAALGLVGVTGTELWDFSYLFGGFQDSVILNDAGVFRGEGAIGFGGAVSAWDGVSSLGPVGPASSAVSNSPGNPTDVVAGQSLVITTFGPGAIFTATTIAVPEPTTVTLLAFGLLGVGYARKRRH